VRVSPAGLSAGLLNIQGQHRKVKKGFNSVPTLPQSGRRSAPARRQLLAVLTAAFLAFQQLVLLAPAASAQAFRPKAPGKTTVAKAAPVAKKTPAPTSDDPGGPNIDKGTGSVSLTTTGSAYTQNFNTLSNTAGSTTNETLPTGWYITESGSGARDNDQYAVDTGGSNTGDTFSYGAAGNTDRALGGLQSGTLISTIGAQFTNNTGGTITSLDIAYTGEQWRIGNTAAARDDRLDFQISTNATNLCGADSGPCVGTYTDVNALDFTNPIKTAASAGLLDGNNAANRTAISTTVSGLSIANGATFWIRWNDLNASGADDGLAIDDFSVTANGAAVVTPNLSINDVSQDEGNAGTTSFTFTVSISAASASNVTFNWDTADGTANAPGDYTAVVGGSGTITAGNTSTTVTVDVGGDGTNEPGETFFVNLSNVVGANVTDGQGQGTIQNDDVTLTPIHDIQGNNTDSPKVGESVTTTGIVTLLKTGSNAGSGTANGFFIQDPVADADPNTSEGIFVFTSTLPTVAVGDSVRVSGTVAEFNGLTELTAPGVVVLSTGNALPTAVTLDSTILSPTAAPTQPQLEKYEGMRMTGTLTTVAPNDNFFDVDAVLSAVSRPMREPGIPVSENVPPDPTSGTPDANIPRWDENPERIKVDTNGRAGSPNTPYTSLTTFTNVAGPLDYSFGEYRLVADATITAGVGMPITSVGPPEDSEFTVASYNIENFDNSSAVQRQKAAGTIRTLLFNPDIIGTIEIDDLAHLEALGDQVNADTASDPEPTQYEAYLSEGNAEGGGDVNQNVGFLVNTARVQVNSVTQERKAETYTPPGGTTTFLHDRPPLVLDAVVDPSGANPQHVFVVVNHLRSFLCIDADVDAAEAAQCSGGAADGPRVRAKRQAQAESLADLLNDLQTANPGVPVISVGDYNAFEFNNGYDDPVSVIKGNPTPDDQIVVDQSPDLVEPNFVNLIDTLPPLGRYSFVFEGTPQALDHHIVNAAARTRNTRTLIARVNADFPEAPASAFATNAATLARNSDHDPVVSYYRLGAQQAAGSLLISEFRFSGPDPAFGEGGDVKPVSNDKPGGPNAPGTEADNDEFIEIYNNTDSDITVQSLDGSAGWAVVAADGVTRFIIPNGTVIAARGYFLGVNTDGYSLDAYATPDDVVLPSDPGTPVGGYTLDIPDGSGIALFSTADPANYTLANRLDAAGYATVDALYREGTGFPAAGAEATTDLQHSFVRRVCPFGGTGCGVGLPKDTAENGADFVVVNTVGALTTLGPKLGAPGPQSGLSPVNGNGLISGALLDPSLPASQPPNRVREFTMVPNGTFGTLSVRRTLTNNTGAPVSYLAFRIIDMTTNPVPTGTADLRALDSDDIVVTVNGNPVDVLGTFVEQPPDQPNGGGLNSSMAVGTISTDTPIEPGDSVSVQFLLGIEQTGGYRFYVNIELFTDEVPESPGAPLFRSNLRKLQQEQSGPRTFRKGQKEYQRPRRDNK
jgi:uncharacterized protein